MSHDFDFKICCSHRRSMGLSTMQGQNNLRFNNTTNFYQNQYYRLDTTLLFTVQYKLTTTINNILLIKFESFHN